jgi:hypothetical protein
MDEREVISDIRWKLSKGKSRAEITRSLQNEGLKLEFIDSLINQAKRPKKIIKGILFSLVLLVFMWVGVYGMFFYHSTEKINYSPSWASKSTESEEIYLEITPELISLIASEIGATKLRRSPVTLKKPIMNFKISEKTFSTIIDKKIETSEGGNNEADVLFSTETEVIEKIFSSENIKEGVRDAVILGEIMIEQLATEQELFLKGYLGLYNKLK